MTVSERLSTVARSEPYRGVSGLERVVDGIEQFALHGIEVGGLVQWAAPGVAVSGRGATGVAVVGVGGSTW